MLGARRDYTYSDITGLREYPKEARLYFGKRHITLDTTDAPQKMFLERVKLHYAAIHDGQSVPYVPPRIDPFRMQVASAEGFIEEVDASGRVLVAPELRCAAGITKAAVLLGMGNHFELWDAETYATQEAEAMKGEMPDVFQDFSF